MGLLDSLSGPISGIVNTVTQGLSTPVKTISSVVQSFGLTPSDLTNPSQAAAKIGQVLTAYGPTGTAGLGRHVLGSALGRMDPLPTYNWYCTLPTIGKYQLPWYYVEEFNAPFRSFDSFTQYREGRDNKYASKLNVSNASLKAYEDSSGKSGVYFEAWRNLVMNEKGISNYARSYKKNVEVVILDVTRSITVYTFTFIGCWPINTDPVGLVSNASDRVLPSIELSVDDVRLTFRNIAPIDVANSLSAASLGGGDVTDFFGNLTGALPSDLSSAAVGLYSTASSFLNVGGEELYFDP